MREATWSSDDRRLDRVLAELGFARSRSHAADLIAAGEVTLDGRTERKAGARVSRGTRVGTRSTDHYVSRAAKKLLSGLDAFGVDATGALALDLGASTGGFTQVLLERGAERVLAVDVGHGQLAPELRDHPRVRVVEGCNARDLTPELLEELTGIGEPPGLVVADLSFISLELVLPAIAAVSAHDAEVVLLIKPQFEVGRQGIREGIAVDAQLRADAVRRVLRRADELGLACHGLEASPIVGEHGNREVLAHLSRGSDADQREWYERAGEVVGAEGVV